MPKINANVGTLQATISPDDVGPMVAELRGSFDRERTMPKSWRVAQLKAFDRMLTEGRDLLCDGMNKDLHKSHFEGYMQEIAMMQQECYDTLAHLDSWMADEPVNTNLFNAPAASCVKSDPLGVVLILGAWNYNVLLTLQPLIGAIAAGNCAVLKPGSYSEHSGHAIAELIPRYMDPSCIRCVEGNRHVTGALLAEKFDMIFFTGSPYVGRVVAEAAAKNLTPTVLELGGKSPCIITADADVGVAAQRSAWGGLMNSGQTCVRPDYYMVHESIADEYVAKLKTAIHGFYEGEPKTSEWYGRLVNDSAFKRLSKVVEDGRRYIVHGGAMDASERYLEPTIMDFGKDKAAFETSEAMQDENFGPIIPIYRYSDIEEVVAFIKARPKPLALYCFTTNSAKAELVLRRTSSGGAIINDVVVHLSNANLPFGGVGDSGLGSYHGKKTFDCFSHKKAVLKRSNWLDAPQRYPPYTWDKQLVMNTAFTPFIGYYFDEAVTAMSDRKNWAIFLMAAYIARGKINMKGRL